MEGLDLIPEYFRGFATGAWKAAEDLSVGAKNAVPENLGVLETAKPQPANKE